MAGHRSKEELPGTPGSPERWEQRGCGAVPGSALDAAALCDKPPQDFKGLDAPAAHPAGWLLG